MYCCGVRKFVVGKIHNDANITNRIKNEIKRRARRDCLFRNLVKFNNFGKLLCDHFQLGRVRSIHQAGLFTGTG
jgi:hypothetical protein